MKLCYALVQSQFLHHIRLHLHGTMFVIVIMLSSLLVMSASAEHSNLEQPNEDIGPVINEPFHPRAIVKRQTTCGTNANCQHWVNNGFCNSTFYTRSQKMQYCGQLCRLC
ncbi:hypothetical protein V3C99_008897 [Haemonchus contortus]